MTLEQGWMSSAVLQVLCQGLTPSSPGDCHLYPACTTPLALGALTTPSAPRAGAPNREGAGWQQRGRAGMHTAVTRRGKATRLALSRAVGSPQPFQPVRLNLCKEMTEVDSKPDVSLGPIPNVADNAHFLSLSLFLLDSRRGTEQSHGTNVSFQHTETVS